MMRSIRRAAPLAGFLALFWASTALAYMQEKLIDVTDSTTNQSSVIQYEQGTNSVFWFKFDVTAISANNLRVYIENYDPEADAWLDWYESASISTVSEWKILVIAKGTEADHALPLSEGSADVVLMHPMPGCWRITVKEIGGDSTSSYTVWHWRY